MENLRTIISLNENNNSCHFINDRKWGNFSIYKKAPTIKGISLLSRSPFSFALPFYIIISSLFLFLVTVRTYIFLNHVLSSTTIMNPFDYDANVVQFTREANQISRKIIALHTYVTELSFAELFTSRCRVLEKSRREWNYDTRVAMLSPRFTISSCRAVKFGLASKIVCLVVPHDQLICIARLAALRTAEPCFPIFPSIDNYSFVRDTVFFFFFFFFRCSLMGVENKSVEDANYVWNVGMIRSFGYFIMQLYFSNVKRHLRTQFGRNTKMLLACVISRCNFVPNIFLRRCNLLEKIESKIEM